MEDKKIKVTVEEDGKAIKSWEGTAAYIAVCCDEDVEGTIYGRLNKIQMAGLISSLKERLKYLLNKYGDDDLKFLLALHEMREVMDFEDKKDTGDEDSSGGDRQ